MKLSLFFLSSAAAMVNATDQYTDTVNLGTAANYAIIAKTGISTVPQSDITGDIAVSPIAAGAITGFDLAMHSSGTYSTATQVTGQVFAADYTSPTPSELTTAVSDMETAYTDAVGRPVTKGNTNLHGGALGGQTLTSGVYTYDIGVGIAPATKLYFDGEKYVDLLNTGSDAVFIIQTTGSVTLAADAEVILTNGAKAENIFWVVAGEVTVGAGAHMEGILLVKTAVKFITGSFLNGRILAQTAATLQVATIKQPESERRVRGLRGV